MFAPYLCQPSLTSYQMPQIKSYQYRPIQVVKQVSEDAQSILRLANINDESDGAVKLPVVRPVFDVIRKSKVLENEMMISFDLLDEYMQVSNSYLKWWVACSPFKSGPRLQHFS